MCFLIILINILRVIISSQIGLVLGDDKLYENDQTEQYPIIQDVLVHDNYTGEVIEGTGVREYDIALLDLGKKAGNESIRPKLQKYLRPLCFPIGKHIIYYLMHLLVI